jgi:hypothetical protein
LILDQAIETVVKLDANNGSIELAVIVLKLAIPFE